MVEFDTVGHFGVYAGFVVYAGTVMYMLVAYTGIGVHSYRR